MKTPKYAVNLLIAAVFTTLVLVAQNFLPGLEIIPVKITGLVLLLFAVIFFFIPFFQLKQKGAPQAGDTYMESTKVVSSGIYAIVRHPQYLGYILLTLGFSLLNMHWLTFIFTISAITFYYRQIITEEEYLHEKFGEDYAAYCKKTPRLNVISGVIRKFTKITPGT